MPLEVINGLTVLTPGWELPGVKAYVTTRRAQGGCSERPWDSFNLGLHVGDEPRNVRANRELLVEALGLPEQPRWLTQVHGVCAINANDIGKGTEADASYSNTQGQVCAIMTADCLPVFLAAKDGSEVAVVHAGWRGLCAGVIEETISGMETAAEELMAWLGPGIGPANFEVGDEVRTEFLQKDSGAGNCFIHSGKYVGGDHWMANLYELARRRLLQAGVHEVSGGGQCTYVEEDIYYSYRRDGETGRMASLIWIAPPENRIR